MNDRLCIIVKSYEILNTQPDKDVLTLTRAFRDEYLVDSNNSSLIERYYSVSKKCHSSFDHKMATCLLEEHMPFIVQAIKDENHQRVIDLTSSMLDYFEATIYERLSA